jgi:hypothetical protein
MVIAELERSVRLLNDERRDPWVALADMSLPDGNPLDLLVEGTAKPTIILSYVDWSHAFRRSACPLNADRAVAAIRQCWVHADRAEGT